MQEFAGYNLVEKLGAGGTAVVYKARKGDGPVVALKILHDEGVTDQMRTRFVREVDALQKLDHPGILKVLDAGQEGERYWYAMEFSEKRSLESVFQERLAKGGILTIEECMTLARGLADSLSYLHERKVVHRDLKPDNLLVDDAFRPTVMDFGLAKDFERSELTAEGMVMGTPRYMAPEQTQGQLVDTQADVYQVGLILYRALAGRLPLEEENPFATAMRRMNEAIPPPSRERPNIPPGLDRILLKALKYRAEDRYEDMGEFREELFRLDARTGALLEGSVMPGALADRGPRPGTAGEATVMSAGDGFRKMTGNTNPPIRAGTPAAEPASRRGAMMGVAFAVGGLGVALGLVFSGGSSTPPPDVKGLEVRIRDGKARIYFETDVPVRSFVRLDPPHGSLYPVMAESSKLHSATIEDLIEEAPESYQLLLETAGGKRHELEPARLGDARDGGLGLGIRESREGDRATLRFRTPDAATVTVRWGTGGTLDRQGRVVVSDGNNHAFELGPLPAGAKVEYEISLEVGGKTSRSGRQTLSP